MKIKFTKIKPLAVQCKLFIFVALFHPLLHLPLLVCLSIHLSTYIYLSVFNSIVCICVFVSLLLIFVCISSICLSLLPSSGYMAFWEVPLSWQSHTFFFLSLSLSVFSFLPFVHFSAFFLKCSSMTTCIAANTPGFSWNLQDLKTLPGIQDLKKNPGFQNSRGKSI